MKRRTHFAVKGCANCRSWRVAWNARNRVEEERRAQLDAIARDAEALRDALRRDGDALRRDGTALISLSTGAAIRERSREMEAGEIAARLRMLA